MTGNATIPSDSGYPEPGGRAPAPAPLRLVQVFVNTADREGGTDALRMPQDLVTWLAGYGLLEGGEQGTEEDLALALTLREGMRALFLTHHDGEHPPDGLADADSAGIALELQRLDDALARLPLHVTVQGPAPRVEPASDRPVLSALTEIAAVLVSADPAQLRRLKACRRDVCRWVFFDTSRNRSGSWCAMDICGVRIKMEAYRGRKRRV